MKKITLIVLTIVLMSALMVLFAFAISADDAIVVRYASFDGSQRAAVTPNEDGTYTLRTEKLSKDGTVTLADGTSVGKEFFGWFTKDGTLYAPGETVTFTESTDLFEAYGVKVSTAEDLAAVKINNYVKLDADLTINFELKSDWGTSVYDLNGHTLTSTNNDHVIWNGRGATIILGKGKIIHTPATLNTNDSKAAAIVYQHHGYGDTSNPQLCWIGEEVEFITPYNFIRLDKSPNHDNMPNVEIFGKITAKNFIRAGILKNSTVIFHESADVTLTGTTFFDCTNQTGTDPYMNLSIDGTITLTNSEATIFSDFLMSNRFSIHTITGGSYTISEADAQRLVMFLPDTLMLKGTENENGTVTYGVVEADCVHDWVLDTEATVVARPGESGLDVFECSKCGAGKQTITVYTPENVEITVTVKTEDGTKDYTVLAGDVLVFQYNGVGAAALCYVAGLKDTDDFTADQIVAFDIPVGVVELEGFDNSTVEVINILDGTTIKIYTLTKMTALKTINVGKATVTFESLVKSTIEKISSKVEGADLKFANNCFYKGANIKVLEMCAGSNYTFGTNAFRECGLTELIFPDNSKISWSNNAFAECQMLEYIYIGSNIGVKEVKNSTAVFDGISNLKKVVIMDLTYLGEWAFSTKAPGALYGPLCDLTVYIHSESLTMHANAFNTRNGDYHVFIYTVQTTLPSTINNCNRVIYQGIGHAYTSDIITESTCVTQGTAGYVTDCPCGIDYRENAYTSYSSYDASLNNVSHDAFGTDIINLPLSEEHTLTDILKNVDYRQGTTKLGTKQFKCLYCDEISGEEEEASFPALFEDYGYSCSTFGAVGVIHTYAINRAAESEYFDITGESVSYGVAACAEKNAADGIIVNADGSAVCEKAVVYSCDNMDYDAFSVKISGIDSYADVGFYCVAYSVVNGQVYYMDDSAPDATRAYAITYNGLVESLNG